MNTSRFQVRSLAALLLLAGAMSIVSCDDPQKKEQPSTEVPAHDTTAVHPDSSHQDLEDLEHLHEAASAVGK